MLSGNGRHRRPRQAPALLVAAGVTGSAIAIPLLGATGAQRGRRHHLGPGRGVRERRLVERRRRQRLLRRAAVDPGRTGRSTAASTTRRAPTWPAARSRSPWPRRCSPTRGPGRGAGLRAARPGSVRSTAPRPTSTRASVAGSASGSGPASRRVSGWSDLRAASESDCGRRTTAPSPARFGRRRPSPAAVRASGIRLGSSGATTARRAASRTPSPSATAGDRHRRSDEAAADAVTGGHGAESTAAATGSDSRP